MRALALGDPNENISQDRIKVRSSAALNLDDNFF
jgi:hypothetical protein